MAIARLARNLAAGLAAAAVVAATFATVVALAPPSRAEALSAQSCARLATLALPGGRITAVERIAPGWAFPPSLFNILAGPHPVAPVAFCRVSATLESEIRIEVWLPDAWNHRFQGVGNGGLTGAINYPALADGVGAGYAAASTDTGHQTPGDFFDATWVDGHPDRVVNFAHRAHHLMAEAAKTIVAAYYGAAPLHSYFTGCSSGGWEGLTEAQRYPGDYDGIVAGAPANNFVPLQSKGILDQQMSLKDPAGDIPPAKFPLIAKAAVEACDADDGLKDGLIDDPRRCAFDPAALACKGADGPDCLTAAQVARVRWIYGPHKSRGGMTLYPGLAWGAQPGAPGGIFPPGDSMIVRALAHHPSWTVASFDPDRDIAPMEAELGPTLDSTDPDLSAFAARGGKLVLYHGWADPLLSPYNTLAYYASVKERMGDKTDGFARLFMVPGMMHCRGGDGPDRFDALGAVVSWVEEGRAPERILAAHLGADLKPDRTRPLCAYPNVARYKGTGSIDDAANFECRRP